jgi:serine/threonine protein kinase/Tol biopolymer transport system component
MTVLKQRLNTLGPRSKCEERFADDLADAKDTSRPWIGVAGVGAPAPLLRSYNPHILALTPGTRLGPYEVTAQIGVGGMGEVYRAIDTNLKRGVAIKVLPASVAADVERLARFQREAEVLAALNHPNIAAIYGLERSGVTTALVMELIDGPTLADRIAQRTLLVDESLPIARQIAEALEAAHERGIIHRDLKPENIKVRADGVVKVLDFGLAKTMEPASATSAGASMSPTITTPAMTQSGMILGTAAYMSPEQARGKTADKRADVWAFGAVLFEMLTGNRAFPGEDMTDTIVSVVSKEPDWRTLPAKTPPGLRRLLARALKKDPRTRLQAIGDARAQIEELLSGAPDETRAAPDVPAAVPAAWPRSEWSRALPWTLAASTLVFALASVLWSPWRGASPSTTALRFTPFAFEQGGQSNPVWAPDGKAVAFAARQKDTEPFQVYLRYLDSALATPITHLAQDAIPIDWTATGRIVFRSTQPPSGLWSVSPVGGEPQPLQAIEGSVGAAPEATTASVSRDGSALAWMHRGNDGLIGLWISSPAGSAPKRYEPAPFATRFSVSNPSVKFSPDGRQILLMRDAGTGPEAWLMQYPANSTNAPHRIFQKFQLGRTALTFSWMPDNRHVVLSTSPGFAPTQLYVADTVSEASEVLSSGTAAQRSPAVSPDGRKLVFVEATSDFDIVSMSLANAVVEPLIATKRSESEPAWAARESAMVYVTDRGGFPEIWLHRDGQLDRPLVLARDFPPDTTETLMAPILSPDATRVIYFRLERGGTGLLWMSAVAGGSPVQVVKGNAERERAGSWSPDGKWLVYVHESHDGRSSLNKVKTTGQADPEVLKANIKFAKPWLPVWSPADDWILYEDEGVNLISPDGKTTRRLSSTSAVAYTFSADGRTIYGIRPAADRLDLFSMSVAGGTERTIGSFGREHLPATLGGPATRLSLTADGKSITFSTNKRSSNLWLVELNGVTPPSRTRD